MPEVSKPPESKPPESKPEESKPPESGPPGSGPPGSGPLAVNRHAQLSRYEARLGTELVTVIDFTPSGDTLVVTHTGTASKWRGHGYAAQTTEAMLNDVRASGARVRPVCPFTVDFLNAHPEYDDLRG